MNAAAPTLDGRSPGAWQGPLPGVRLTVFSWWGGGVLCTRMLTKFGAEVIKIEDRQRLDCLRMAPPFPGKVLAMGQVGRVT